MPLSPGSRLGPYEILSPIGAGGMGEVYRARDLKLHRDVAVKVLTAALASDAAALARFEREAQSVAQLSHPNILAIHDFGRDGDTAYAVMELLDGQTLRERLAEGRVPVRTAIDYAIQIAQGLAAAHDKGIVHRDLKPENLFITRDDRVKILDFGLARPASLPAAGATVTAGTGTAAGTVLGTFGYMAPEQLRAQPLDHRLDLFAFGAVLYEMLTGRRAFAGATPADTITAILQSEPADLVTTVEGIPPALDRLVRRALNKRPELRFQSAHDLGFALETVATSGSGAARFVTAGPTPRSSTLVTRVWPWLPWAAAIVAAGTAVWALRRPTPVPVDRQVIRLDLALPSGVELHGTGGSVAIAPDGRSVAFIGVQSGTRQVYLRRLEQPEAAPLKGTERAIRCFFSPDGQRLGVIGSDGIIIVLTLNSGSLTPLRATTDFGGAAWTAEDRIVFTRDRRLWRVETACCHEPVQVPSADDDVQLLTPVYLPGSDRVLVTQTTGSTSDIASVSLTTGERQVVVANAEWPIFSPTGRLFFLRNGTLVAVRFDPSRVQIDGPQIPVLDGLATSARAAALSLSETGTLVYASDQARQGHLVWVSREGLERPLTRVGRPYLNPRISPDGRYVVVQTVTGELWIQDIERDTMSRLSTPVQLFGFPMWLANGTELAFTSNQGIHRMTVDGGRNSLLPQSIFTEYVSGVSPDGSSLATTRVTGVTSADIYVHSLTGAHPPRVWLRTPAYDGGAKWSPDGRWMVYGSTESGQMEVYLQPYPGSGIRRQVSVDGGGYPLFSRDGREIFYRQGSRMWSVGVERVGTDVRLSQPRLLFDRLYAFGQGLSIANFDVSADGRDFLMVKDAAVNRLNVIVNWLAEVEARAQ